ncbi:MAG: dockerin type I repeat-containing protein [Clostridia bacterium]|nr:dockerin type I repeat-containing protein [Clostridia bacterium]
MKKHILSAIAAVAVLLMSFALITASAFMIGDVNDSGGLEAEDARLALRAAVGLQTLSEEAYKAADVDFSGTVDAADARSILRAAVGLEELKNPHTHAFNGTVTKQATCTEDGIKTFSCECGEDTYTEVIPKTGHDYVSIKTLPTCTAGGYTTHTCKNCNDSYKDSAVNAKGHTPGKAADCLNPQKCTACNAVLAAAKGHTPGKAADCTNAQTCSVCSAIIKDKLGHDINTKVSTVTPTCTEKGYDVYKCSRCTVTENRNYKNAAHTGTASVVRNKKTATCTSKGYTGDIYWSCCDALSAPGSDIAINADAHTGTANVVKNKKTATCTSKGYTGDIYWSCCDALSTQGSDIAINAAAHTGTASVVKNKKTATCTSKGYTGDIYWSCCDALSEEGSDIEIDANAHTGTASVIRNQKTATCTAGGYTGDIYWSCCDALSAEGSDTEIDANAHTGTASVIKNKKTASCEEEGYTGDTHWSCCNALSKSGEIIEKLPHSFGKLYDAKEADVCIDGNIAYYSCTECLKKFDEAQQTELSDEDIIIKATEEHVYQTTVIPPTCTESGYTVEMCSYCSKHQEGSEIRDLVDSLGGHDFEIVSTVSATCTEQGYHIKSCKRSFVINGKTVACGVTENEYFGEIEGHKYEEVEGTKTEATCLVTGKVTVRCQRAGCGDEKEQIVPLAPCTPEDSAETVRGNGEVSCRKVVKCKVCEKIVSEDLTQGHNMEIDQDSWVDATCTTPETVDKFCAFCDYTIEDVQTSEPLGHNLELISRTEPSCDVNGLLVFNGKCSRCGEGEEGQNLEVVLVATGHKADGIATCTRAVHCIKCFEQIEPALGHDYNFFASAYNADVTAFSCVRCGHTPTDKATNISTFNTVANKIKGANFYPTITEENPLISIGRSHVDTKYSKFDFGIYTSTIRDMYEEEMKNTPDDYSFRKTKYLRSYLPIMNNYNTVSELTASDIDSIRIENLNGINVRSVLSGYSDTFTVGKNNYDINEYKNKTISESVIKVTIDIKNEAYTKLGNESKTALEKITGIDIREDYTSEYKKDPETGKLQIKESDSDITMVMTLDEIKSDAVITYFFDADTYEPILALYDVTVTMEQEIDMDMIFIKGEMDPIITTKTSSAYLFPNYFG